MGLQYLSAQKTFQVKDLGLIEYTKAYALQRECVREAILKGSQYLLLCEHPCVLTLGRLASEKNLLCPRAQIERKGIQVLSVDRGGDVTLHSPGQLVVYPILDLKNYRRDLKYYLSKLEQVAIDFLKEFDILTCRIPGRTGVWAGEKKIVSVGIGVTKWIAFHGMAVNINTDLDLFSMIKPCGLDVKMTSIREIKSDAVDLQSAKKGLVKTFCKHFDLY